MEAGAEAEAEVEQVEADQVEEEEVPQPQHRRLVLGVFVYPLVLAAEYEGLDVVLAVVEVVVPLGPRGYPH